MQVEHELASEFYTRFHKLCVGCSASWDYLEYAKDISPTLWDSIYWTQSLVLKPTVFNEMESTRVGWTETMLDMIRKYAIHIDENMTEAKWAKQTKKN